MCKVRIQGARDFPLIVGLTPIDRHVTKREVTREEGTTEAMEPNTVQPTHPRIHATCTLTYCVAVPVDALPADDGSVRRSPRAHCASVERGSWHVQHVARWRCVEGGGVWSPPLPGAGAPAKPQSRRRYFAVPDHTGGAHPTTSGLIGPLPGMTHSPEGGSQWCQITPGVPRLLGV